MKHLDRPGRRLKPSERVEVGARVKKLWLEGLNAREISERVGIDKRLAAKMMNVYKAREKACRSTWGRRGDGTGSTSSRRSASGK